MTSGTLTRRERQRAATVEEIKEVARGLMREQGASEVRFTDIAKVMGMTPPALYRYYDDRDALLTDLIADGYRDLGRAVAEARERVDADDVAGRWIAVGRAYRDWARAEPAQFALILGMPLPGYVAPEDGPTTDAAKDAMSQLLNCSSAGGRARRAVRTPGRARCPEELRAHFEEKDDVVGWAIEPADAPGDAPGLGHPARHHLPGRLRPVRLDGRGGTRRALRVDAALRGARGGLPRRLSRCPTGGA